MCCRVLQCVAVCFSVLHCVSASRANYYHALQHTATQNTKLACYHYIVTQNTFSRTHRQGHKMQVLLGARATQRNRMQHLLQPTHPQHQSARQESSLSTRMTKERRFQHTTIHCNTLQHTATHCNTLQHTILFPTPSHTPNRTPPFWYWIDFWPQIKMKCFFARVCGTCSGMCCSVL